MGSLLVSMHGMVASKEHTPGWDAESIVNPVANNMRARNIERFFKNS
jgi:hypothetical protein